MGCDMKMFDGADGGARNAVGRRQRFFRVFRWHIESGFAEQICNFRLFFKNYHTAEKVLQSLL